MLRAGVAEEERIGGVGRMNRVKEREGEKARKREREGKKESGLRKVSWLEGEDLKQRV